MISVYARIIPIESVRVSPVAIFANDATISVHTSSAVFGTGMGSGIVGTGMASGIVGGGSDIETCLFTGGCRVVGLMMGLGRGGVAGFVLEAPALFTVRITGRCFVKGSVILILQSMSVAIFSCPLCRIEDEMHMLYWIK